MSSSSLYSFIMQRAMQVIATTTQAILPRSEQVSPMNENMETDNTYRKIVCGATRCKMSGTEEVVSSLIERCK